MTAGSRTLPIPTAVRPRSVLGSIRFVGWLTYDAIRDFVWGDLKDGVIDLRGLGPALRALVWLGFALLLATLGALLASDTWRGVFELVPLTQGIPGRGRMVPSALVPASLFLLAVAWSFVLAGALRARRSIFLLTVGSYCLTIVGSTSGSLLGSVVSLLAAAGSLLGLLAFLAVRRRRHPRPAFDFLAILVLVAAASATIQAQGIESWRASGTPVMVTRVSFDMVGLTSLITPLLLLVGMGIAGFVAKLAGWTVSIAEDRLPRWSPFPLLALALGWRLWEVLPATVERLQEAPRVEALSLLNALGIPLIVLVVWLVVRRLAPGGGRDAGPPTVEEIATAGEQWAPRVILGYSLPALAGFFISQSALVLAVSAAVVGAAYFVQTALVTALQGLSDSTVLLILHLVVEGLALAAAVWLARRGQQGAALYLGIYALMDLKSELSADGMLLGALTSPVPANRAEVWWAVILAGLALGRLVTRRLTRRAAVHLLFLALLLLLLGQTDFISNRFTPFFGFAGIAFLAFGIAWDALTIGSWANVDSRGLPRTSRIFLYLGYILLTVAVVNWAVASHDLTAVGRLTGDIGLVGLDRFGRPMLYAIIAATLALPVTGEAGPEEIGVDEPDDTEPA